ncbi:MAG: hypothetical protein EBR10_01915 [Planctomycetes bacterium]|nr:hypothetical protein [Planctomycetota bacterium]
MTLRLAIIRLMLLSLFAAGVFTAVLLLVDSNGSLLGKAVGTCAIIAVGCGLLLPTLPRSDAIALTPVGIGAAVAIAALAVLGLLLVWIPSGWVREGAIVALMFLIGLTFPALAVPLRYAASPNRGTRRAAWGALLLIGGSALGPSIAVGAAILQWTSQTALDRSMGMWVVLTGSACGLVACACGLERSRHRVVRIASLLGILLTCAAGLQWTVIVLQNLFDDVWQLRVALPLSFAAGSLAVVGATSALPLGITERRLIPGIVALLLVAGGISFWVADGQSHASSSFLPERLLTADLLIAVCLAIAVAVIYRVGAKRSDRSATIDSVEVLCPRCGKRSRFASGSDSCKHCGLRILIAFNDVRCPKCHHDVSHLDSASLCPECGTSVDRTALRYVPNAAAAPFPSGF